MSQWIVTVMQPSKLNGNISSGERNRFDKFTVDKINDRVYERQ